MGEYAPNSADVDGTPRLGEDFLFDMSDEDLDYALSTRGAEFNNRIDEVRAQVLEEYGDRRFSFTHGNGTTQIGTAVSMLDNCPHAQHEVAAGGIEAFRVLADSNEITDEDEVEEEKTEEIADQSEAKQPSETPSPSESEDTPTAKTVEKPGKASVEKTAEKSALVVEKSSEAVQESPQEIVVEKAASPDVSPAPAAEVAPEAVLAIAPERSVESTVVEALPPSENAESIAVPDEAEMKVQAIESARALTAALFVDVPLQSEPVESEVLGQLENKPTVIEAVMSTAIEADVEPDLVFEEVRATETSELLEQPEFAEFVELFVDETEAPVETYEEVFAIVQEEQDVPVEIALAQLIDVPLEIMFSEQAATANDASQDQIETASEAEIEAQLDCAYTPETFKRAMIRLRIELAYVDIDETVTFEQLPESLKLQLIDLLYRLGYDDAFSAMQDLMQRHGLEYLLYFISQVGVNMERTARQHTAVTARKKKQHADSGYTKTHSKIAQFVIDSLRPMQNVVNNTLFITP